MVKLVTTDSIIAIMNAVASEERGETGVHPEVNPAEIRAGENPEVNPAEIQAIENLETDPEGIQMESQEELPTETQSKEVLEEQAENQSNNEPADEPETGTPVVTTRSGRQIMRPSRYAAVTKVSRSEWKQERTERAIKKELSQMFEELVAIVPVKRQAIPSNVTILNSHMFVVNKYDANGEFKKVKARLVADGRDQDPTLYPNKSSPTVAIHSVFTVLGMIGEKPWLVVAKIDIKGAFVQTPMTGPPIYMRLDPKIMKYAKELYPELDEFQWKDQCVYTVMLKAMYGCVQASALWYVLIRSEFEKMGYSVSETDKCMFIKQVGEDKIFTLLLHVDDILAAVDAEEADELLKRLKRHFGEVQFEVGNDLSYLGMKISVRKEGTTIDMSFYVAQVLEDEEVEVASSPTTKTTYNVNEDSKKLDETERKWFHSKTAKLLYLAKRARPDVLTAVIFLCTRIQEATCEDREKLKRVLGYLKGTAERKLFLHTQKEKKIVAYVDAAYAVHNDSKSHSGVMIRRRYLGICFVKETKVHEQKSYRSGAHSTHWQSWAH
jgi:hypothetical protein